MYIGEMVDTIRLEYIWLDAEQKFRSKTKIHRFHTVFTLADLPQWNYDGSSTGQANTRDSEVVLIPKFYCRDPQFEKDAYLVLCTTHVLDHYKTLIAHTTNTRQYAERAFGGETEKQEPMFGLEQEFFIISRKTGLPLGFDGTGNQAPQGPYYCGVGAGRAFGRHFVNEVVQLALAAGLPVTGSNFEVAPGQAEIQICGTGINAADQLTILRYLLVITGEKKNYNYEINFDPKPLKGDWNGTGCHINISTKAMREGPMENIMSAINCLKATHSKAIQIYGEGNSERLTGKHETSSIDEFTWGVADRGASIRVPRHVLADGKGYIEDRRPAGNVDPYLALALIMNSLNSAN